MKIAWFFPGQGSQFVGMGKGLAESSSAARTIFERSDEALGASLSKLIFDGPDDVLNLTANTQPAIVTVSIAILAAFRERFPELPSPAFAAGHSLGEYSALVAAGALSLEDALRTVRARGEAMQAAVPPGVGAMAAVMGLESAAVEAICAEASTEENRVWPANFNAPGQVVLAGHSEAVARASELVAAAKGKAVALKVSAPFHCPLMKPAALVVAQRLSEVSMAPLAFPVVANFNAMPNHNGTDAKELLVRQVDGPVRWEETVRFMHAEGVSLALEIGPGKVLTNLNKRIAKEMRVLPIHEASHFEELAPMLST